MRRLTTFTVASLLGATAWSTSGAQYLAPAGVWRSHATMRADMPPVIATTALPDSVRTPIDRTGGIVGGVLGGALGGGVGAAIAATHARNCREDLCGLGEALIGFGIGEPIGLAIGTHVGARGHGNVALSSMASFGILAVGTLATIGAAQLSPALGVLGVVAVPTLQIMAALAVEH